MNNWRLSINTMQSKANIHPSHLCLLAGRSAPAGLSRDSARMESPSSYRDVQGHLAGHVVITQCHFSSRYLRIIGNKKVLRIGENLSSRKLYILVKDKIKARDCTSEVSDQTGLNNRGEQTKL